MSLSCGCSYGVSGLLILSRHFLGKVFKKFFLQEGAIVLEALLFEMTLLLRFLFVLTGDGWVQDQNNCFVL